MKKATKVVLGVLAGVVMIGTAGAAVWLAVSRDSGREVITETEVRSVTLAELPDGEVNLDKVRELYEQFEISALQGFYRDELLTAEVFDSDPERGRLEMALNQAENWTGATVRAKYQEMFGEEIELSGEKYSGAQGDRGLAAGMKFVVYDEEQDEFRELEGGTDTGGRYIRRLERAEKAGNKVYLYERALTIKCQPDPRFDEEGEQIGGGSSCGILMVAATCGTPDMGWSGDDEGMTDEEILREAADMGLGLVRWTFELTEDGRFVYRGMERVMRDDGSDMETDVLSKEKEENE